MVASAAISSSDAPGWTAWALRIAALVVAACGALVWPLLRWRTWRYEVRDEEIDLLRGALWSRARSCR